jgi:hypothetical protein
LPDPTYLSGYIDQPKRFSDFGPDDWPIIPDLPTADASSNGRLLRKTKFYSVETNFLGASSQGPEMVRGSTL